MISKTIGFFGVHDIFRHTQITISDRKNDDSPVDGMMEWIGMAFNGVPNFQIKLYSRLTMVFGRYVQS